MSNCIGSLRTLDAMDWRDFVESLSHIEQIWQKTLPVPMPPWTLPP